jgi:hypothetical protein
MRSKLVRYAMAVAAVFLTTVTNGMAAGGTFTRGCAARDIQVMMMLEASNASTQQVDSAMHTILHARVMCFGGQVMDALALYDDVAQSINSDYVLSGRP